MTDDELAAAFETAAIEPAEFGHREHLRVAWVYLQRHGRAEAEQRLLRGLRDLAVRAGKPAKFSETLTAAWVERIDRAAALHPNHSFDDLLLESPDLLDRGIVREATETV